MSASSGAYLAWKMDIPLVGSWHTNLHEYAARRFGQNLGFFPKKQRFSLTNFIERKILDGAILYYRMPQILLAPNQELIEMLEKGTGRKARLMIRGVDTEDFFARKKNRRRQVLSVSVLSADCEPKKMCVFWLNWKKSYLKPERRILNF